MVIIWSNQAKISYENIIDNILKQWSIEIALKFELLTNKFLDTLKKNSKLCPVSEKTNLRKCVIHKTTSLIYKITNSNIELVSFIDNRSNHGY